MTTGSAKQDLDALFTQVDRRLPIFVGTGADFGRASVATCVTERDAQWRKAAIAASLERAAGSRSDGPTQIQRFADHVGVGPAYISRLASTYRAFDRPDDPEITRLLADTWFSFKHFMMAASAALDEARQNKWSASQLGRMLEFRRPKPTVDTDPAHDDDDLNVDQAPSVPWKRVDENIKTDYRCPDSRYEWSGRPKPALNRNHPPELRFSLTETEHHAVTQQLRELGQALGTSSDLRTLLLAVQVTHMQREKLRERLDAARGVPIEKAEAAA